MSLETPYIRIGTTYYKILNKPTVSGDEVTIMSRWNKDTIRDDYKRNYFSKIPKLDGFCCIPDHINYKQIVGKFYNTYHELPVKIDVESETPKEVFLEKSKYSIEFMKHIFGDQIELGLDYIKLLVEKPTVFLPILCLVSKERATGKSSFIKWLRNIFGANMTYIKGDSFSSQFNADWASKLIVAVDEVFFDKKEITERLKYLSTTNKDKVEAKGRDREEIDFFAKFILCSNNEEDFIQIDAEEIRFWVRKINPIQKENVHFLELLEKEISDFINYLYRRPYSTRQQTRMWFRPEDIKTETLRKLMWANNNRNEKILLDTIHEIFESVAEKELLFAPKDLSNIISKLYKRSKNIEANEIRKILKKWKLTPADNSLRYDGFENSSFGEFVRIERTGRYYRINKLSFYEIYDELMRE